MTFDLNEEMGQCPDTISRPVTVTPRPRTNTPSFPSNSQFGVAPPFPRFLREGGHSQRTTIGKMQVKPVRYQNQRCLHFITFSCYRRMPLFDSLTAKETFERTLERVRLWYGCYITGYVVDVHLLIGEPERSDYP